MSEQIVITDSAESLERQALPGERLQQARIEQGLSEEDVARRLNISVRYVRAIEELDVAALPNLAFARGYIRAYARFVNLPADQLIDQFNIYHGHADKQRQVTSITKVRRQVKLGDPLMRWSVWLFVALVIGASGWWWQTQSTPVRIVERGAATSSSAAADSEQAVPQPGLAPGQPKVLPLAASADPAEPSDNEEAGESSADAESEPQYLSEEEIARLQKELDATSGEAAAEDEADAEPAGVTEAAEVAANFSEAGETGRLVIKFSDVCWLSVTDGAGKVIFADTKRAGEVLELDALRPVKLRIGRASAVSEVSFDGQVQNLADVTSKNVARLTLP